MADYIVEWEDHDPTTDYKLYCRQKIPEVSIANRVFDMKIAAGIYDVRLRQDGSDYILRHYTAPDESEN